MKKFEIFSLALIFSLCCATSWAQVYSPIFILNSSNVETQSSQYIDHSPGSSFGFGLVVTWPFHEYLSYRTSVALQNRKFHLTYNDNIERRYGLSTLDIGGGLQAEFLDLIGVFVGAEITTIAHVECKGGSPCERTGGEALAAQFHAGMSLGSRRFRLEPYWEHMPFSPISGIKSLTSYGLAIHFYPESFDPN